jgi:photosystem II stability/assembly factor-like uncharacterized protein
LSANIHRSLDGTRVVNYAQSESFETRNSHREPESGWFLRSQQANFIAGLPVMRYQYSCPVMETYLALGPWARYRSLHLLYDEFIIDREDVGGRMCKMITQEPQSFRLSGSLSEARPIMGFVLLVLLLFPGSLAAASMKLLTPNTGWAAYGDKLYWTYNNGADWADITPVLPDLRREAIRSVHPPFFRDKSEGWTIVEYRTQAGSPLETETAYSVAHTVDSGASWSFTELTYPQLPHWDQLQDAGVAPANLFFIDSLHGWLVIAFAGNARPGKLLATVDGGKTWNWVNSAGFSGPIVFATLQDGWQFDEFGARVYVTHDGCKTWQEVSPPAPPQIGSTPDRRFEGVPVFQDQYKGYLVVQYVKGGWRDDKLVIYSTSDSGTSWHTAKVLDQAPGAAGGILDIVDSTAIVSTGSSARDVRTATVPLNGGASGVKASDRGITTLKFADKLNGWILTGSRLLATQDGGSSWKDITPPSALPRLPTRTVPIPKHLAGLALTATPETLTSDSNSATTLPYGINDASQVADSWVDTSNNFHGFLYDNNAWTPLDHSGTKDTGIRGINGIGQFVGYYVDGKGNGHGFVYSNTDGWTDFNCAGQSSSWLTGINNNGQVIGTCGGSNTPFMYDLAHGTWYQVPGVPQLPPGGGVSDNNTVAGKCGGSCTSPALADGFYATPNP